MKSLQSTLDAQPRRVLAKNDAQSQREKASFLKKLLEILRKGKKKK